MHPAKQPVKSKRWPLRFAAGATLASLAIIAGPGSNSVAKELTTGTITIDLSGRPISKFRPDATFGAALDGKQEGQIDRIYTTQNIDKMRG
jgi:hypothetical protein